MINFYIDESGSFVPTDVSASWNVTAAVIVPGSEKRKCKNALSRLKCKCGYKYSDEVKLKNIDEKYYQMFLAEIEKTNCTLYGVATDASSMAEDIIAIHREGQAAGVEAYKNRMHYDSGKNALETLADQIRSLSLQLYVQIMSQVELVNDLVDKGITYYVQRTPKQLNGFRWEIDEKLAGKSNFEKTFESIVPPLLQTRSLRDPHVHLSDCDYSSMMKYFYTQENMPTYLHDQYGIEITEKLALNVGKVVWDDFRFVDSKNSNGVQIADLLASGLRRCLRRGFGKNIEIAEQLGRLMVQSANNKPPIKLITLSDDALELDEGSVGVLRAFERAQKMMLS